MSRNQQELMRWQEHISQDPAVLNGKPVITGTRISVELILELLENGWTQDQIFESYPNISPEALPAVFAWLRDCVQHEFYFQAKKTA